MPELPDLLYIQQYLRREICTRSVTRIEVRQPIVLRSDTPVDEALRGQTITACGMHGNFLRLELTGQRDLIINLMLAGKLQHQRANDKPEGYLCLALVLDDGSRLNLCDKQHMAKAYFVRRGEYSGIPKYDAQGVDILDKKFTTELFKQLAAQHSRKQVRVFINDHTILSSIGNAYADEILFDAGIHPKTFVGKLTPADLERLHRSILGVMAWGIATVERAGQPIHIKVRDHMKVRNRKGEPCPRCGTTIRREGVRGFDVFFCPDCQPASRKLFLDWGNA